MIVARQSTARTVMVGPVLDADGVAVTDCVVGDFEGSVNGGDPAALNGSATLTHRGVGFYSLALTATDLGTVGSFEVTINDTTNACPMKELTVIEEAVYDALFAASAAGYQVPIWASASSTVSLTNTTVATVTTTTTATNVTTVNGLAANVITAASMAADASAEIADAVWDEDATGHQTQGTFGQAIGDPVADTNTIYKAVVTDATGATVGVDVAAVLDDTGTAGVVVASLAAGSITASVIADGAIDAATFAADVDAEILSYLVDDATRIDASALNTAAGTTIPAILADTAEIGAAGAGLTEAGGTGDHLTAVPWNAAWDAEVQSECADALTAYGASTLTQTQVTGGAYALNSASFAFNAAVPLTTQMKADVTAAVPTAAQTAVAVRDVANGAGVAAVGSLGEVCYTGMITAAEASGYAQNIIAKLGAWAGSGINTVLGAFKALFRSDASAPSDIGGTFDPATDSTQAIRDRGDAAWTTATGFSTLDAAGVRTAVGLAAANLDTQIGTLATAASLATAAGYIDTEVAAIKAKTDLIPAAPAAVGDIPTVSQIWTTALAEAYRSTGAAGTAAQLLHEVLQNLTEFTISGVTKTVKKFDGSTTAKTYTLDDASNPTGITEAT